MDKKKGYVYVLCDPATDLFKIGMTRGRIERRLKELQTGNGTELHIAAFYATDYPITLENMLHHRYSDKQSINEWFSLSASDVASFQGTCDKLVETIEALSDNPFFKAH